MPVFKEANRMHLLAFLKSPHSGKSDRSNTPILVSRKIFRGKKMKIAVWMMLSVATLAAVEPPHMGEGKTQAQLEAENVNPRLRRAGLVKTKAYLTPDEQPQTFSEAWAACLSQGMTLPTLGQLVQLKAHLGSLLSDMANPDQGFLWSISKNANKKYPRAAFSLETGQPTMAKADARGFALCVKSNVVAADPAESAYGAFPDKTKTTALNSTLVSPFRP